MNRNVLKCAYQGCCKGICNSSSCLKDKKTEDEYWEEIKTAMIDSYRLKRIKHYVAREDIAEEVKMRNVKRMLDL